MSFLYWILLGLIAGAIASFIMKGGFGIIGDILVGIVGAVLGGWLFSTFTGRGVDGFDPISIIIAIVGACILIAILRAVAPRNRR